MQRGAASRRRPRYGAPNSAALHLLFWRTPWTYTKSPARAGWLSPAQQASYDTAYLEAKEFHAARVRFLVVGVLAGRIPFCIGWFQRSGEAARLEPKMDSSDLLDAIGLIDKPELLAKLAVAGLDQDAKNEALADAMDLVLAYVEKTADLLAKAEAAQL